MLPEELRGRQVTGLLGDCQATTDQGVALSAALAAFPLNLLRITPLSQEPRHEHR